jgi:murein DD-endopeptidase MepM/ murein hydrolase activator NlpD
MIVLQAFISWLLALWRRSPVVPLPNKPPTSEPPTSEPPIASGTARALITHPETIGARFHDTGSPAWVGQWKGTPMENQHGGLDMRAPAGSGVYAPYPMRVIAVGYYPDAGRKGFYVIGDLADGVEYYSGHLSEALVSVHSNVAAGTMIGHTNEYAHTHIQMKRAGHIIDPETYLATH